MGLRVELGIGVFMQFVAIRRKRIITVHSTDQIHSLKVDIKANTEKLLAQRAGIWWHGSGLLELHCSVNKVVYLRFHSDCFGCGLSSKVQIQNAKVIGLFCLLFFFFLFNAVFTMWISCWLYGYSVSHIWIIQGPFPRRIIKATAKIRFVPS